MQHPKDQQNIVNQGIIPCERQKLLVSDRTPMSGALKMPQRCRQCVVKPFRSFNLVRRLGTMMRWPREMWEGWNRSRDVPTEWPR
jgi:hypothetical protein